MKKQYLLTLIMALFCLGLSAQSIQNMKGSQLCSMRKSANKNRVLLPGAEESVPGHSFNVLKYTLDLDIRNCFLSPYPKSFTGTEKILFKVDSTLNSIDLNAVESSLDIHSVGLAGTSFSLNNDILTINLNQTYNQGDTVEVLIDYGHKDVEDEAFYASNGFVFTDAEPEGARKWFPCWDKPSDKAKTDIRVKVPGNVKLGSNGALADSVITGDTIYYHWVSAHNVATYLTVITGKVNYKLDIVEWENPNTPGIITPIRFYYNSNENPSQMESVIGDLATWYSTHFCNHPFEKNGFATLNSQFSWGGMENQTLTSLCPSCWYISVVAHEFAHQWFGDMITCATWADIWLNEGFGTWSEAFWYEKDEGYDGYKSDIEADASYYLNNNPGWAISEPDWAVNTPSNDVLFNYAITYTKGACVLHMLRYTLGDSLFFSVLQSYAADTMYKYQSATITDFMAKVNQVTGGNYDWFFNQWIFHPNHPDYQNTYNFEDLGNGQWKVNLFMTQVQPNPEFFKMPVEILIHFDDLSDTTLRFMNEANYQQFSWTFDKKPVHFVFDPDDEIVLKEGSTTVDITEPLEKTESVYLSQNMPNPATGITTIVYEIREASPVKMMLTDITGKTIRTLDSGQKTAGKHSITFDCRDLPAGFYFYTLKAGDASVTHKMVISK